MSEDFDLESLVHLEQTFYEEGYKDGFEHGKIHGLIEGRALGRAKGFEMWEEVGFYEGFARMWQVILEHQPVKNERAVNHSNRLLSLISQFPRQNPSYQDSDSELDVPKLFRQIRSRYKILCSTLGVRPTLRYSERSQDRDEMADATVAELGEADADHAKERRKNTVWKIENDQSKVPVASRRGMDF